MKHVLVIQTRLFIEREQLFTPDDRLLLAISGGIDSLCLAHVLRELGYSFSLAHVNYNLRGVESDGDQAFVENLARQWGISLYIQSSKAGEKAASSGEGIQETARKIRYEFFTEIQEKQGYDYVLTAHHLEDNLETTLLNLLRGTGVLGTSGIPPVRSFYRRPFLEVTRSEIEDYAAKNHLLWREDASNAKTDYQRNHLRHQVLPGLKRMTQHWAAQLRSTYQHLRADHALFQTLLSREMLASMKSENKFDKTSLPASPQIAERLLARLFAPRGFSGDQFRQMLNAKNGTRLDAADHSGYCLVYEHELRFYATEDTFSDTPAININSLPADVRINPQRILKLALGDRPHHLQPTDKNTIYLPPTAADLPLTVRPPYPGDRFEPFGMKGQSKKIKDLLTDEKLDRNEKEKVRLLCNAKGEILWVIGLRGSELGRIKDEGVVVIARLVSHQ